MAWGAAAAGCLRATQSVKGPTICKASILKEMKQFLLPLQLLSHVGAIQMRVEV